MNIFKPVFGRGSEPTDAEIALVIENFVNRTPGKWEWDDFISVPYSNERIKAAGICLRVGHDFPRGATRWCSDEGLERLRAIASQSRGSAK